MVTNWCKFKIIVVLMMINFAILASDRTASERRALAKAVQGNLSSRDQQRWNNLREMVSQGQSLNSAQQRQLTSLLNRSDRPVVHSAELARLRFATSPDINSFNLSDMTYWDFYNFDYHRISEILRRSDYNLMVTEPDGRVRLDIVMEMPPHIRIIAIETAIASQNQDLLNAMAQWIVNHADRGEDVMAVVHSLRRQFVDESFIDNLLRRTFARFAPSTAQPPQAKNNQSAKSAKRN